MRFALKALTAVVFASVLFFAGAFVRTRIDDAQRSIEFDTFLKEGSKFLAAGDHGTALTYAGASYALARTSAEYELSAEFLQRAGNRQLAVEAYSAAVRLAAHDNPSNVGILEARLRCLKASDRSAADCQHGAPTK
jgi:hypothetical protein